VSAVNRAAVYPLLVGSLPIAPGAVRPIKPSTIEATHREALPASSSTTLGLESHQSSGFGERLFHDKYFAVMPLEIESLAERDLHLFVDGVDVVRKPNIHYPVRHGRISERGVRFRQDEPTNGDKCADADHRSNEPLTLNL